MANFIDFNAIKCKTIYDPMLSINRKQLILQFLEVLRIWIIVQGCQFYYKNISAIEYMKKKVGEYLLGK